MNLTICRGTVFVTGSGSGGGVGFKLSPDLSSSGDSPILMQSLTISDEVVNLPVVTLTGKKILYVFGSAWGNINVGGIALLGAGGSGDSLGKVVSWFKANAVKDGGSKAASVSFPGGGYRFYATGLQIGDPNTEFQYFPFSVTGKIIEPT